MIPPGFDPVAALDAICTERATITLAVPTMLAALAEEQLARPRDVATLRSIVMGAPHRHRGAAPSPRGLSWRRAGSSLWRHRAGAAGHGAAPRREPDRRRPGPVVRTGHPGGRRPVRRRGGQEMPPGRDRRSRRARAQRHAGYWNKPEQTAAVLQEGCYRTGDLGFMDEEGYLFLVDRAKDMIVSAARTSTAPRSRRSSTGILRCWRPRSSACPMRMGGSRARRRGSPPGTGRGQGHAHRVLPRRNRRLQGAQAIELAAIPSRNQAPGNVLKRELGPPSGQVVRRRSTRNALLHTDPIRSPARPGRGPPAATRRGARSIRSIQLVTW